MRRRPRAPRRSRRFDKTSLDSTVKTTTTEESDTPPAQSVKVENSTNPGKLEHVEGNVVEDAHQRVRRLVSEKKKLIAEAKATKNEELNTSSSKTNETWNKIV